ncbi:vitamin B12-dependent ribonucleotide reductase [Granulicella tundricola]|uniref:Vitamin B12-dependent ribonucleotide reductase n=1 Tax=Granulicella tundricola (strain ATCC BAA-1859 / DSM 23138 / MP5ACTX9) TaxID=1198114 RepID=E8X0J4_GRATM|nr:vitamin B12-dependent ribonucleotide reductase [Granulicella tundricola]ADW67858.1 ribonucleoside-diphosphate reductase, adenosylcobalamin-dependent [Granulicella tundricola MP5ACTX9]
MNETLTASPAASKKNQSAAAKPAPGLTFDRYFTTEGVSPYDQITWELRDAIIQDWKGKLIFEQKNVESPVDWSMTATNIVASKYLHGLIGTPERESGVRALITRVAESIRDWGMSAGYFADQKAADIFYAELAHLLLNQKVAFNSPVWFNVGCDRLEPNSDAQNWHWDADKRQVSFSTTGYTKPQCSACFINSVQDSLDSILTLAKTEGMLFKWGSGAGSNLSSIRGSMETLSGGGTASGPLSFMRGFDAFAGVIKSGGKTRRAAKMVVLNVDHPDIVDFIECKSKEEAKAYSLIAAGYDGSGPDSEAYSSIFFQNANNSVRVTDEFMSAVERDAEFSTRTVKERTPVTTGPARDIMNKIAENTWACGDPGMQYDTTINKWHTSKNTARINASNPCSEYMFLDDSACNLASFNLIKFVDSRGQFDIPAYRSAIAIVTTAMEIIVDSAGYPTEMIAKNSHDYRPLGLGYANLGALLMSFGLPYDSDAGRDFAGTLTAILCGDAYYQSALIAETCPPLLAATPFCQQATPEQGGACPGFYMNREPFLDVIRMHRAEVNKIGKSKHSNEPFSVPQLDSLIQASKDAWDAALIHGEHYGFRNSQVTVLAPTGTIGFMMDCDTTGIEPDLALVKYKKLVGGGMIKIVNNTVPSALTKLGYSDADMHAIVSYIDATGTIEGAPAIKAEHLAVFDCSFKPAKGTRSIHYMGHIKMMAAAQPFLSGAISKTVNLPTDCSVEDIAEAYLESWRQGIKAVAIYRDGSKGAQPLNVSTDKQKADDKETARKASVAGAEAAQVEIDETIAAEREAVSALASAAHISAQDNLAILSAAKDQLVANQQQVAALQAKLAAHLAQSLQNSDSLDAKQPPRAVRHRLPAERASVTHKFGLGGHEGYITVGLYPNGQPGEIFIRMAKEGSTVSGLMDSFATAISLALQHGVPLRVLCEKFAHTRFEPSGWTGNEQIGYAKSLMDYMFRWIEIRFLSGTQLDLFSGLAPQSSIPVQGTVSAPANTIHLNPSDPAATDVTVTTPPQQVFVTNGPNPDNKSAVILSEAQNLGIGSSPESAHMHHDQYEDRTAPRGGIAPDLQARSGLSGPSPLGPDPLTLEDRGIYHTSAALRSIVNMGDAPSCATCGAIMTRNGSCYRCGECGSTSGCS